MESILREQKLSFKSCQPYVSKMCFLGSIRFFQRIVVSLCRLEGCKVMVHQTMRMNLVGLAAELFFISLTSTVTL